MNAFCVNFPYRDGPTACIVCSSALITDLSRYGTTIRHLLGEFYLAWSLLTAHYVLFFSWECACFPFGARCDAKNCVTSNTDSVLISSSHRKGLSATRRWSTAKNETAWREFYGRKLLCTVASKVTWSDWQPKSFPRPTDQWTIAPSRTDALKDTWRDAA